INQIDQPLGEERRHVKIIRAGANEKLSIACPAQPLVALRAVGWHLQIISLLSPDDVVEKLIDQLVRALKSPCARHIRMDYDPGNRAQIRLASMAGDFNVAEAMKGEDRLKGLLAVAFAMIRVDGASAAQSAAVKRAIRIEHLR